MKIRIGNVGDTDLIVTSAGGRQQCITPLSFGGKVSRDYVELTIGDNEVLMVMKRGARDPEGVAIKSAI